MTGMGIQLVLRIVFVGWRYYMRIWAAISPNKSLSEVICDIGKLAVKIANLAWKQANKYPFAAIATIIAILASLGGTPLFWALFLWVAVFAALTFFDKWMQTL